MRTRLLALLALLALVCCSGTVFAWDGHDRLRRVALSAMPEIAALPPVPVTERSLEVVGTNPAISFPFVGPGPGETQSPADILVGYAMEPDWGMDQNMKVSWQQKFMGGTTGLSSQGYFHMYYPAVTLHLPIPVTSMGVAPKRAAQWRAMASRAFSAGDAYWGWRFAAWSLHYLEDVAQPYHSTQTHRRFLRWKSPIEGTTNCTSNFHLLYETWLDRRLADELAGKADFGLKAALSDPGELKLDELEGAVKAVARKSHRTFGDLAKVCIGYFGDRFVSDQKQEPTPEDLDRVVPGPGLDALLAMSRDTLRLAGRAIRGAVRDLLVEAPQPPLAGSHPGTVPERGDE